MVRFTFSVEACDGGAPDASAAFLAAACSSASLRAFSTILAIWDSISLVAIFPLVSSRCRSASAILSSAVCEMPTAGPDPEVLARQALFPAAGCADSSLVSGTMPSRASRSAMVFWILGAGVSACGASCCSSAWQAMSRRPGLPTRRRALHEDDVMQAEDSLIALDREPDICGEVIDRILAATWNIEMQICDARAKTSGRSKVWTQKWGRPK